MKFVDVDLSTFLYEKYPFEHIVIDNFLKKETLPEIVTRVNSLKNNESDSIFTNPSSPYEFNKYAFTKNYGEYLKELFVELNSPEFIQTIEKMTGIQDIITNDITLKGGGVHRITNKGHLQLHTDFNSYYKNGVKLDRRLNLLIYLNPEWKDHYNGSLWLCDKNNSKYSKKISPILNRCVIFNTTNKSIHGHPIPLNIPNNMARHSIAVYYYTKNTNNDTDFEGDKEHSTIFYTRVGEVKSDRK
jgi:Rps23 Pro-64 3,4-dihydroxylase Tpa1-like proline 4-hydroxylase